MKQIKKRISRAILKPKNMLFITLLSVMLFNSCNTLKTAVYDQYSYQKSIEIKIEASHLMDKAVNEYSTNIAAIESLNLDIEKIVEYEKNKPNNEITYAMWKILSDKEKHLLSGFFVRWKEKGKMSPFFIKEAKGQVMEALDLLIQYEGKKDKVTKDKLLDIITNN